MAATSYSMSVSGGGVSIQQSIVRITDGVDGREITLPVAKSGTVTTRTDADTGVITVASGHGITTSNTIDLFWAGGMRYGMTVTATTSTTISIDAGSGDNLPTTSTAVSISSQVTINVSIDGDLAALVAIKAETTDGTNADASHVHFVDASAASVAPLALVNNVPRIYDISGGATNVFTGNIITQGKAANGSLTAAVTLKIIAAQDSTP